MQLPIELLVLSALVSILTQGVKYLGEKAIPDWDAEVPQVVAAVLSSAVMLAKQYLPASVQAWADQLIASLGAPLSAALVTAGAYVIHNVAGILQGLLALLPARKA